MSTFTPLTDKLRDIYTGELLILEQLFTASNDGFAYLRGHSELLDSVVQRVYDRAIPLEKRSPANFAFLALGDYGRRELFPQSEIDLLFLTATPVAVEESANVIQQFSQGLGAIPLKLNLRARSITEYGEFVPEEAESVLALLDCRFLAGDQVLFANLRNLLLPEIVAREAHVLVERLAEMTRARHRKFGNTVYHLEPNMKDGPGGYRDYVLACWLTLLAAVEKNHVWPESDAIFPSAARTTLGPAFNFMASVRCFLHISARRDENILTWDAQKQAALRKVGTSQSDAASPAEWMRLYFHHAHAVQRISDQLLEAMPSAQSMFYRQLETWRTGFSDEDFSVVDGLIFLKHSENVAHSDLLFRMIRLIGERGFKLSPELEREIEQALPSLRNHPPMGPKTWRFLQEILQSPHAIDAVRTMHSLHLLSVFVPEMQGIDALAIHDYSHRFTVDEHTIQAFENLHRLPQSKSKWDTRYAAILGELEQPELLQLAILLHVVGKAITVENHIPESLNLARGCLDRFELTAADRETVLFLIEHQLIMGAALRRDIFNPQAVAQFASTVGTPDRLKMLCLFTLVDTKAVSPEALSPWKAEDLWQLYIATANYLDRSADERVHADANDEVLLHLRTLALATGVKLQTFLEGLPWRYLRTHPVDEILRHYEMSNRLAQDPVQLALKRSRHWYELTLVTTDRPRLFTTMAGALAACGMNIGKAAAFSNQSGIVVDTFYFTDLHRTLEMNLPEWERFKKTVHAVLTGTQDLNRMLRERVGKHEGVAARSPAATQVQIDDNCSPYSTLVEIITADQTGLLHRISSVFAGQECNIDIALIDTEGQTAIDVFYLTSAGGKLPLARQESLRRALVEELAGK